MPREGLQSSHGFIQIDNSQQTFVFRRRLQDVMIKTNIFVLAIRLQKMSSRRLKDVLVKTNIFVLAIRLQDVPQDVFKTFSRCLVKTSSKCLEDVLQKRLQDIFKASSRRLAKISSSVSKTYHLVKLSLLTRLREVFNTFLRRTAKTVIYRRICRGHTSEKYVVSVPNLQVR